MAYDPEFWPEECWDEDIRLMREGRVNLVRIGEFAWTLMEPAAGRFDLGWLLEAALRRAGIEPRPRTPKWVEVVRRGDVMFAVNHSPEPCTVDLPGRDALAGEWRKGKAKLGAYGVCVVRG